MENSNNELTVKPLLKSNEASSVLSIAKSMLSDKKKLMKLRKAVEDFEKSPNGETLKLQDEIIKKKTGGYSFEELFNITTVEVETKDGAISHQTKVMWKYPQTYLPLPPQEQKQEQTESADSDTDFLG